MQYQLPAFDPLPIFISVLRTDLYPVKKRPEKTLLCTNVGILERILEFLKQLLNPFAYRFKINFLNFHRGLGLLQERLSRFQVFHLSFDVGALHVPLRNRRDEPFHLLLHLGHFFLNLFTAWVLADCIQHTLSPYLMGFFRIEFREYVFFQHFQ